MGFDTRDLLARLADHGDPAGAEKVLDRAELVLQGEDAASVVARRGRPADPLGAHWRVRPPWLRNAFAFAAGSLGLAVAVGAVVLLQGPASEDAVTTTAPAPTTSAPATTVPPSTTTTVPPSTTTTVAAVVPAPDPPRFTWERIDSPGAFDLAEGEYVGRGYDPEAVPGQTIETILAVEDCPDGPGCGEIAGYVAGGRIGLLRQGATGIGSTAVQWPEWDAAIWISEDGRNWTAVTGPGFTGDDGQRITALASDGSRIVAVGTFDFYGSRPLVWYSDDLGRTWTEVEDPSFATRPCREWDGNQCFPSGMMDVAWTGEGFVAVGDGFWFSPDGISWELTTDLEYRLVATSLSRWGSRWIAVGRGPRITMPGHEVMPGSAAEQRRIQDSAAVWISDDARSWELVFVDDTNWGFAADVVVGSDGPVAVGWTWAGYGAVLLPAAWRSGDGTAWEAVFPTEEQRASVPRWQGSMDHVARIGEWLIATDEARPNVWASPDGGTSWIDIPVGFAGFDLHQDRILAIEVLPFGSGGEPMLIATGFHLTDAAVWVGTLEE
jgi:hypothetical protein